MISAKRPDVVRFPSRGGSNRNGRSLTDRGRAGQIYGWTGCLGSTLRFATEPAYAFRLGGNAATRAVRSWVVYRCRRRRGASRRGMKLWGTIGYRDESVAKRPEVVRPGSADAR